MDWLGISIDSSSEETEKLLGRGWGSHVKHTKEVTSWAHKLGIKLKINTVVTRYNLYEDLKPLYRELRPHRIKVFQFLPIRGENDRYAHILKITEDEFDVFVSKHLELRDEGFDIVFESNKDMLGSYVMLLPSGRFFNNTNGEYILSKHTLFIKPRAAFMEIKWDINKFLKRGGKYEW